MELTLPTQISIMGKNVQIHWLQSLQIDGTELSGCCRENVISINVPQHSNEEELLSTLFHEIAHFIFLTSGIGEVLGDDEEAIVVCIERNIMPFIKFDRRLWKKKIKIILSPS
jgi:hypothetical protein